ncbi:hypothetical protein COHA_009800 [Chlorella ohadii]|uniref:Uncharacterized protein n=1 Tax=Chlorella ohadii TaxID=2649997 RepID=A0AAD5DHM7_9CHLO|nr:hypothetical protein COHA_009800 [Chlorella ohadii]
MKADLSFEDDQLEHEFRKLQAGRSRQLGKQFHLNRAGVWGVALLRVLASRELRLPLKVSDNLLQISLGCYMHHLIYPNPKQGSPSTFQMAAVLLTGNGVPWQLFNSIWESLPFRYAFPQQAALTILLLLFNRSLCQHNVALRYSYVGLQLHLARLTRRLLLRLRALPLGLRWVGLYQAGTGCAAAVLAAPPDAREAVRAACMQASAAAAQAAAERQSLLALAGTADVAAAAARMEADGVELQLLLGFVFPTLYIWCAELRLRRSFLQQHTGGQARRAAGREREPGMVEYLMFAVPAVACMWSVVAVHA